MTAGEMMAILEDCDPDTEVRIAQQPAWAFEYAISDQTSEEMEIDGTPVIYLIEGCQIGYLPQEAADAIGW